jgi:uncharacterized protein
MTETEMSLVRKFKSLVEQKLHVHQLFVFGSRARGDADPESDLDVLVVIDELETQEMSEYISDCAWEACFESGIVLTPVVYSQDEWENSPERSSFLALAVGREGIPA